MRFGEIGTAFAAKFATPAIGLAALPATEFQPVATLIAELGIVIIFKLAFVALHHS